MKTALVEYLRDEIIQGDHVPGQYLRLEEVVECFDVSTMPVREALRDMKAEGLVSIFPHRGAVVTKLSADDCKTSIKSEEHWKNWAPPGRPTYDRDHLHRINLAH